MHEGIHARRGRAEVGKQPLRGVCRFGCHIWPRAGFQRQVQRVSDADTTSAFRRKNPSLNATLDPDNVTAVVTICSVRNPLAGSRGNGDAVANHERVVADENLVDEEPHDVQFQAPVSSSGGATQAATSAVWGADAPAVATVSPSGLVTAVSAGEATISAEVTTGGRGSLRIRVFPQFHGHWEGDLNVTSVTVPPDWRELGEEDCDGLPECASWIPLAADFTQDGATVTGSVTSTFAAPPNYEWTVQSGTVSVDGTLSLTSGETAFRLPDDTVEIRARLMSWESRADAAGVMTGTAAVQYSSDALSGDAVVEGCLEADNILRECSGWRRPGGRSASLGARRFLLRSRSGR